MKPVEFDLRDWQQINDYLDEALALDPQAQARWLEDLATHDPRIARMVRDMLVDRENLDSDGFLERSLLGPAVDEALHEASMTGQQIGAYSLDRLLGRGGMGEVWLASRSDGRFEGRCAIKFLCATLSHPKIVERFRQEAALLARLGHPHIARLFDAGATDTSIQYLVLEYVDGLHIDEYCEQRGLDVRARVRLCLDAVAAVAHAHSHLIVHRDLKPSNVLVTADGTVKLLDFGIAKLLDPDHAARGGSITRVEEIAVTPEYAAPEQLLGDIPSTMTDVYQLGMLLYVLLTRRHPLDLSGSRAERIKKALEEKLPRASEFAAAEVRRHLRGDLDAILAKALHVSPEQRYPTADALHDDLRRYLNHEPVIARRGARMYGISRFIARHRAAAMATLLALVSLCGTLLFALEQSHLAARERDHALALASRNLAVTSFLGTLINDAAEADKPVTVAEMLERSEKLALADKSGNPETRATVLQMIGDRFRNLGNAATAARLYKNGMSILAGSPDQALRSDLECKYASMMVDLGQRDAGIRTLKRELEHLQSEPRVAAECLFSLSFIAANENDAEPALRYAEQALARFREAPMVTAVDEGLILNAVALGNHLYGRNSEAERYFRLALQQYEKFGRAGSSDAITVRNNWAVVVYSAGAPKRALEINGEIMRLMSERYGGQMTPTDLFGNRARTLESIGRFEEARAMFESALQMADERQIPEAKAYALTGLASTAQALNDRAAARKYLDLFDDLLAHSTLREIPARRWRAIAGARLDMDYSKFAAARDEFAQSLGNPKTAPGMAARLGKSEAELRAGDPGSAAQDARLALDAATHMQGDLPFSNFTGLSWLALGRAMQQLGQAAEARSAFRKAELHLTNTVDGNHPALLEVRDLLLGAPKQAVISRLDLLVSPHRVTDVTGTDPEQLVEREASIS
jgi:serine/threonine protein kinase